MRSVRTGVSAALLALGLAACATHTPRPIAQPAPPPLGTVKIGKPYQVAGVTYVPGDDRAYDQTGIASWYGPGFHALSTANGERYDQDGITAAHKTLPMPSYVEVENLDNGRRLTVRVNDRGPFVAGRIIDLSRKSAQLLGVDRPGTAHVRVRRVYPDALAVAALAPVPQPVMLANASTQGGANTPVARPDPTIDAGVRQDDKTEAAVAAPPPVATVAVPSATPQTNAPAAPVYVQVAALSDQGRAAWLSGYVSMFGPVVTERSPTGLVRVRLGPYNAVDKANAALAQVRAAGYSDARLVAAPKP